MSASSMPDTTKERRMIKEVSGNLLDANVEAPVNTVNTIGVN